ncbi:uncharacterized protein F5891DRAFT_157954 [Suillus fuscotomentosus]|uniref:Uncharacterized protein n=1 Tax=Suillus fuscotomentosus TaxID=1912939 RepID=A0AAD4EAD7_9AGAM|nr:uncharacterized protein F5891DRAFT_157954 [Suillus fuscotomentosus]KAG1902296.1 hypothetical protein F5891DRAFT_157954 [Suillus fuscotomentosus]
MKLLHIQDNSCGIHKEDLPLLTERFTTLGQDRYEGWRFAMKGSKCPKMTPFVRFGLLYRAVELTGNLGVCRIQESSPGDRKYDEGVVFLMSAMEDAKIYTTEAPQRCKIHEERVILVHLPHSYYQGTRDTSGP